MRELRRVKYIRKLSQNIRRRMQKQCHLSSFCLSADGDAQLFALLAKRKPIKIRSNHLPLFQLPEVVKVVVTDSKDINRPRGVISYGEEEEGVILTQIPTSQFLSYSGALDLSIAQMRLPQDQVALPSFVSQYFTLRNCGISSSTIQAINLWFYRGRRLSSWHYDGHDNFLFQLEGTKMVKLMSPLSGMQGKSVFSVNSNHHADTGSRINAKMEIRCRIGKGECLFIPRGWWHEVQSQGQSNIAINVWGNSLSAAVAREEEEAMLRHLMFAKSERLAERVSSWMDIPEKIKEKYRRNFFQIYLNSSNEGE